MRRPVLSADPLRSQSHWWHRIKLSTQKFAIVLTAGAFAAGFGYVMMTNSIAAKGFAIKGLQQQLDQLQADNQKLDLQAADLRALSAVDRSTAHLDLQPADQVDYITTTAGSVAVK